MSLPKYLKYKDSGAPWLGSVPRHWAVQRFKWLIKRNDGGVWGDDPDGVDDTAVLRSTEQTVDGYWQIDEPAKRKLTEKERRSALLEKGDLLLTKSSGSALHIGKTTLVDERVAQLRACYSNFMQRLRVGDLMCPKIAWYILNNSLARVQLDLLSNSTTGLANLNGTIIGELVIAVPPHEEQTAIVTFLDRETTKIDALIAEQEKLIVLLAEKRQATISHAVTKGLDPNAPMKDSGLAWLGEVPAHWAIERVKVLSRFTTSGPRGWSERITEDGSIFIQSGDLTDSMGLEFGTAKRVNVGEDAESTRTRLAEGDLVVCITGAKTGNVAFCKSLPEPAYINQHLCLIRPADEVDGHFLTLTLKSTVGQTQFELSQYGLKQGLSLESVRELWVTHPPYDEQLEIVAFIEDEMRKLSSLAQTADAGISLLKERRSALIAAAVTGQIDVRNTISPDVVESAETITT